MGAYEWFIWQEGDKLRTSNLGYGNDFSPLRDAFIQCGAVAEALSTQPGFSV